MLGAGVVGEGALRIIPVTVATLAVGSYHTYLQGFTLEAWVRMPSTNSIARGRIVSFLLASTNYAVAVRWIELETKEKVFWPIFFWTAPPSVQCITGPQLLTASTGTIGDGPGLLPRYESEGPLSCSWIIAPGGTRGGFQEVTLFFTEYLLTSR